MIDFPQLRYPGKYQRAIKLMSREALRDELKRLSPPRLNMRVDASVPTGKTQDLLLDCQDLGILAFLTTENKKEE